MTGSDALLAAVALVALFAAARTYWVNVRRRFAKVSDGVYRAGAMSPRKLRTTVQRHGIRTVIDFRRNAELVGAERALLAELGVRHVHVLSPQRPGGRVVELFLAAMQDAERPVLLHCTHGAGRTPLFAAVYLIRTEAWPEPQAVRRAFWPALNGRRKLARLRRESTPPPAPPRPADSRAPDA